MEGVRQREADAVDVLRAALVQTRERRRRSRPACRATSSARPGRRSRRRGSAATSSTVSPTWSPWPCVTAITSMRSGCFSCVGRLRVAGQERVDVDVLAAGRVSSRKAAWPSQVSVAICAFRREPLSIEGPSGRERSYRPVGRRVLPALLVALAAIADSRGLAVRLQPAARGGAVRARGGAERVRRFLDARDDPATALAGARSGVRRRCCSTVSCAVRSTAVHDTAAARGLVGDRVPGDLRGAGGRRRGAVRAAARRSCGRRSRSARPSLTRLRDGGALSSGLRAHVGRRQASVPCQTSVRTATKAVTSRPQARTAATSRPIRPRRSAAARRRTSRS